MQAPAAPEFYEAGHLGGFIIGGDPATFYPHLWEWLVREHGVFSVMDVGCGEGHALAYFHDVLGIYAQGVDGVEQDNPFIWTHDYTQGPLSFGTPYDLVWSCEFVEHVEERYVPNFLASFAGARLVAITHAEPGQPGYHHVNCRSSEYWKGAMTAAGFAFDEETTLHARYMAAMNRNPINHFARSGLVFRGVP
jgi:hypothetical protein